MQVLYFTFVPAIMGNIHLVLPASYQLCPCHQSLTRISLFSFKIWVVFINRGINLLKLIWQGVELITLVRFLNRTVYILYLQKYINCVCIGWKSVTHKKINITIKSQLTLILHGDYWHRSLYRWYFLSYKHIIYREMRLKREGESHN